MKVSRRAKRMKSHHDRKDTKSASLNMVSLMDIFTILVFFLLVNASAEEILPTPKNIVLPNASSEKIPTKNLVIAVNNDVITLQGKPIVNIKDIIRSKSATIRPLFNSLMVLKRNDKKITSKKGVTIMGDKEIPYALLKKIMLTCAGAEFTNLSFAVNQKSAEKEG